MVAFVLTMNRYQNLVHRLEMDATQNYIHMPMPMKEESEHQQSDNKEPKAKTSVPLE